ncbi:unnamed protein product [Rhodiola kirilowii]
MDLLGITMDELSNSQLLIHGFNLKTERAIGMIRVNLSIEELSADTLFHVIDVRTSFKLLLGRPWKHENGVVASTLHQCLKYYRDGERKINGDVKPFTKADSFFADAKFFEENGVSRELLPLIIPSTRENGKERPKANQNLPKIKSEIESKARSRACVMTHVQTQRPTPESTLPILRYIPKSRRKAGQRPLEDCKKSETSFADQKKTRRMVKQEWVAKVVIPLPSANTTQVLRPPPEGFIPESIEPHEGNISLEGKFGPNAYKLMEKSGYDFKRPAMLGEVIKPHPYSLAQIHGTANKHAGLGYKLPPPVKISIRRQKDATSAYQITADEIKNNKEEDITEYDVATSYHVTAEVPNEVEEVEVADQAPEVLEDGGQSNVDDLKEVNLGTTENPRPIYVSTLLTKEEEEQYLKLLAEYKDVFAWNYTEMPGLNPKIALHRLAIKRGVGPKKQSQQRFRPELVPEIEKEVNKLIDADFIREVKYPTWIANIVPVRKKNGQLRVCVDFRDLNEACPKDDFPLPVTELMIDATTGHEALSFMDCTVGYNQIHMAPEDQDATAFRTSKEIFCYKVMPFGLKNAGAT